MLKACLSGPDVFLRRFLAPFSPLSIFIDFTLSAHRVKWAFFANFFDLPQKNKYRKRRRAIVFKHKNVQETRISIDLTNFHCFDKSRYR